MNKERKWSINKKVFKHQKKILQLTDKDIAISIKVNERTVRKWSGGEEYPQEEKVGLLCKKLKITEEKLRMPYKKKRVYLMPVVPFTIFKKHPIAVIAGYLFVFIGMIYAVVCGVADSYYEVTANDIKLIAELISIVVFVIITIAALGISIICAIIAMIMRVIEEFKRTWKMLKL